MAFGPLMLCEFNYRFNFGWIVNKLPPKLIQFYVMLNNESYETKD
ncbi:hypothetical protein GCM10027429_19430 [Marivirga atlantica]